MTVTSMTGFARTEGDADGCTFLWEAKSVNARGLEVRCRLPQGLEGLEPAARKQAIQTFKRGSVSLTLQVAWKVGQQAVRINTEVLDQMLDLVGEIERRLGDCRRPSADGLLGLRGVIETVDPVPTGEGRAALERAVLGRLDAALADLAVVRRAEGERLADVLHVQLDRLELLALKARELAAAQPQALLDRLREQLATLLGDDSVVPADRLAHEVALLAAKADMREELDRIAAHRQAAAELLRADGPIGRQLDFLCQEFNREVNTLCAKSADIELTRLGLDLKAVVEQMREQVQNIE